MKYASAESLTNKELREALTRLRIRVAYTWLFVSCISVHFDLLIVESLRGTG